MTERFLMDPDTVAGINAIRESRAKTLFPDGIAYFALDLSDDVVNGQRDETVSVVGGSQDKPYFALNLLEESEGK